MPLVEWRDRVLAPGAWGDAGLVLVALWLIAQLNPALPFFGAGNIPAVGEELRAAAPLEWGAVALGVCGFGLFISALLRGEQGSLRVTLVLLSVALWLKFVGASFLLQPQNTGEWVTSGRFLGLGVGLAALYPLRRLPRAARTYVAILVILAGALLAKIFGAYSPLDELLRVFRWPYGQLANFATLTRYLHELWPFARAHIHDRALPAGTPRRHVTIAELKAIASISGNGVERPLLVRSSRRAGINKRLRPHYFRPCPSINITSFSATTAARRPRRAAPATTRRRCATTPRSA